MRIRQWATSFGPRNLGRDRGVQETTERVRQLVDGMESAISSGDDLALATYLAPPALGVLLAQTGAARAMGSAWLPARTGLRWIGSSRSSVTPGRFWLRLRFEDRTQVRGPEGTVSAAPVSHEVEVELETSATPWRLCQAEEVFRD
jgi:hypothetical protein